MSCGARLSMRGSRMRLLCLAVSHAFPSLLEQVQKWRLQIWPRLDCLSPVGLYGGGATQILVKQVRYVVIGRRGDMLGRGGGR